MFEDLPKILRDAFEGGLSDEQRNLYRDNPDWMKGLQETAFQLKKDLKILKDITKEKDVPWNARCRALTEILHYTLSQKPVEAEEKQRIIERIIIRMLVQYPEEETEEMLNRATKSAKKYLKGAGNFVQQSMLGTELIKDALGESKEETMSDKEIEAFIETIKVGKELNLKVFKDKTFRKMKREMESWTLAEIQELFSGPKDELLGLFALFPDTMVKKIEEAAKSGVKIPPFLLKIAERWRNFASE